MRGNIIGLQNLLEIAVRRMLLKVNKDEGVELVFTIHLERSFPLAGKGGEFREDSYERLPSLEKRRSMWKERQPSRNRMRALTDHVSQIVLLPPDTASIMWQSGKNWA